MFIHVDIHQDKISIYKIIIINSFFCLSLGEPHFLDHPFFQSFCCYLFWDIYEVSLFKHMFFKLIPWFLFKKNVETLNYHNVSLFVIKFQFFFSRVFFCVVKVWKAAVTVYRSKSDIVNESLRVKSELCSSPCMSMLWVLHLVKLFSVIVVSVHSYYEGVDSKFSFQIAFQTFWKIAFAWTWNPCYTHKRYFLETT